MRLLVLTPMPPDPAAASAIPSLLHAELTGLRERHDLTLVTVAGPDPAELEAVERLRAEGFDVHAAVRTLHRGTLGWRRRGRIAGTWASGRTPLRTAWFAEPEIQAHIDRLCGERGYDAALVEDNAMAAFRLPRDLPAILTEYEVRRPRAIARPPRAPGEWGSWAFSEADWHRWRGYQRRVWQRFDVLQVVTERDAAAVRELAADLGPRVRVNPFPVALPALDGGAESPAELLFAGNYTHPPNVDAAVWLARDIMPRLARLRPDARLTIAGAAAPPAVRALDGDGVCFVGAVPDLAPLLRRAAVVLAPVRTGGGMRMKVLHAMAFGKAVVTTPRGAEGLGREAPVAIAADADGLACATARLLDRPQERLALGRRARAHVEAFHSPAAYADRLEPAIEEALAARR